MKRRLRRRGRTGLVLITLLAACGVETRATSASGIEGTVRILAASSLTDAFDAMAGRFEAAHPRADVSFTFAASSALVQQVVAGAPADAVATADGVTMRALTDDGRATDPQVLARNRLTILVGKGNPERITGLADLARAGLVVVLCAPEVPCGRLAGAALRAAGVRVEPASREENVRSVATKVVLGEADAGIAYVTDARAQGDRAEAVGIEVSGRPDLEAVYSIATTSEAENPEAARAWIDFVLSSEGQAILARTGFLPP